MKKKNIFLLSAVAILSLVLLSCLLVYNLKVKKQAEDQNAIDKQESIVQSDVVNPTQSPAKEIPKEIFDSAENVTTEVDEVVTGNVLAVPIVLGFAGDINFNEESKPIARYDRENKGILGGLSSDLVEEMNSVDIMILNNEFAYSTRGTKTPDKSYTFRADPSRVDILHEMGVDIVSLANNHALDYGQDALLDTFTTLDNADIDYIGAGENMDRAKAPVYYTLGDTKIAYVAASRVVYAMDWYATETTPGMIGTYDPTLFLSSIEEAAANSDFVIAYVHWGVERNHYPEKYQRTFARQYIDAGADVVIGCHPHVMQGIEFYKGKPIAYSLGNFWFNNATQESALLKVYLDSEGTMRTQILPVMAEGTYSYILQEEKQKNSYFDFMEEISYDVTIDEEGFITETIK